MLKSRERMRLKSRARQARANNGYLVTNASRAGVLTAKMAILYSRTQIAKDKNRSGLSKIYRKVKFWRRKRKAYRW